MTAWWLKCQFIVSVLLVGVLVPVSVAAESEAATRFEMRQTSGDLTASRYMVVRDQGIAFLAADGQVSSLFDRSGQILWMLDHSNRIAAQVSEDQVRGFLLRWNRELAAFEASLTALPEDQRALSRQRFEQLFARSAQQTEAARIDSFRPLDRQDRFGGITCRWHQMIREQDGEESLRGSACLAAAADLPGGVVLADLNRMLLAIFEVVKKTDTGPLKLPMTGDPMLMAAGPDLVALRVIHELSGGAPGVDLELVSVSTVTPDEALFRIPDGYRRQGLDGSP